jgi:caffeoyl-CoA O-methyltransferase
MNEQTFAQVDTYITDLFHLQDDVLKEVVRTSEEAGIPAIAITPVQGQFLFLLGLLSRAHRILEIGTLGGYSGIWLARSLPVNGRLVTLDHDPHHADIARQNFARAGVADKVEVRVGNALESLTQMANEAVEPFDMVFIDADKPPYPDYLRMVLRLTRPGSLIVADNAILKGDVVDPNATNEKTNGVRTFNQMLASDQTLAATIVQMVGAKGFDGIALAVVRDI